MHKGQKKVTDLTGISNKREKKTIEFAFVKLAMCTKMRKRCSVYTRSACIIGWVDFGKSVSIIAPSSHRL